MEPKKRDMIYKQLIINSIRLPMDMVNEIKDFLFNTYENFIKRKKRELVETFRIIYHTRISIPFIVTQPTDIPERWVFIIYEKSKVISGYNCYMCGQYLKSQNNHVNNSECIYCSCERQFDNYTLYMFF